MKINNFIASVIVSILSFHNFCFATANGAESGMRSAIVDMQSIESKALIVNDLVAKLQAEQSKLQDVITEKSKDLQRRARELESKRGILSNVAIEEQRKSLENELVMLQNDSQMKNEILQRARVDSLADIDSMIRDIIAKIAKDKYKTVLAKQVFLYVSPTEFDDITETVINDLNTKAKTIDMKKYLDGSSTPELKSNKSTADSKKKK